MTYLKIAAVQLDFQPCTRTAISGSRLDEPLSPSNPLADLLYPDYALASLKTIPGCRDVCNNLIKETYHSYISNISAKLKEIVTTKPVGL